MDALVLLRELAENNLALKKVADMIAEQYVKLPTDCNGEVMRTGDRVERICDGTIFEVEGMTLCEGAAWEIELWDERADYYTSESAAVGKNAMGLRHHKPQTVEDVLEELLREYDRDDSELTNGEIVERFAAKLRLVEGVDA